MKLWIKLLGFVMMAGFGIILLIPVLGMLERTPLIVVAIFGGGISFLITFGLLGVVSSVINIRKKIKS